MKSVFSTFLHRNRSKEKMTKRLILSLLLFFSCATSFAQLTPRDSSLSIWMVRMYGTYQKPGGNLANRFGNSAGIGIEVVRQINSKWQFSLNGGFILGRDLKEDSILKYVTTSTGDLITESGIFANYNLLERGWYSYASVGRLFRLSRGATPNCGITTDFGVGFMQHKIKLEASRSSVPYIQGDYQYGYDRLTNGFALRQSIGYQFMGINRLTNFHVSLEIQEGFTQNRRPINFDTMMKDNTKRIDLLIGARFAWTLPIYRRSEKDYYLFD